MGDLFNDSAVDMTKPDVIAWMKAQYAPLTFATPDATLGQCVDNAVRYWNINSGYRISTMVATPASGHRVQIHPGIKTVVQVFPSTSTTWIWNDHPLWTMMGIQIMDNVTGDLIMMSEAYRSYRVYVGSDMRWMYDRSHDPAVGGYLYLINVPHGATDLCVVGTKRILPDDTLTAQPIIDFVTKYSLAMAKEIEGNTLRKGGIIDLPTDGGDFLKEGLEAQKKLEEELERDGRWVVLARRS